MSPHVSRVTRALRAGVGLALALAPSDASAHLVTTGLGPLYDGLVHFAVTPEDLVPALALALFAGLRGIAHGRRALFVLPGAWLAGGAVGLVFHGAAVPVVTAMSFVVLGILVAADVRLPLSMTTAVAAALGLLHGALNGAAMARPGLGAVALVGIVAAVFALVALVASLRGAWPRVAVRVAGSWIAAIGLLLFGWALRGAS